MALKKAAYGEEITGHKTFDRQCDVLTTGNVQSNTQFSAIIRSEDEIECNGKTFKPGELLDFDLGPFLQIGCPLWVLKIVRSFTKNERVILYQFRHWRHNSKAGRKEQVIHGWIITDYNHGFMMSIPANYRQKSLQVLTRIQPFISRT